MFDDSCHFSCEFCQFRTNIKSNLVKHKMWLHDDLSDQHFDLSDDDDPVDSFDDSSDDDEEDVDFDCDHCGFKTKFESNLVKHKMWLHNDNISQDKSQQDSLADTGKFTKMSSIQFN